MTVLPESTRIGGQEAPFLGLNLAVGPSRVPFGSFKTLTNCYVDHEGVIRLRAGVERVELIFDALDNHPPAWTDWRMVYVCRCSEISNLHVLVRDAADELDYFFQAPSNIVSASLLQIENEGFTDNAPGAALVHDGFWSVLYLDDQTPQDGHIWAPHTTFPVHTFKLASNMRDEASGFNFAFSTLYMPNNSYLIHGQRVWYLSNTESKLLYSDVQSFDTSSGSFGDMWGAGIRPTTNFGTIHIPTEAGRAVGFIEYRDSIVVLSTYQMMRLDTEGPEAEWSLDVFLPNASIDILSAITHDDVLIIVATEGIFITDGVTLQQLDEQLDLSISALHFLYATREHVFLAAYFTDSTFAAPEFRFLVYTFKTDAWAEFDFEVPFATYATNQYSLAPYTVWRGGTEALVVGGQGIGVKPGPLGVAFNTWYASGQDAGTEFFYSLPISYMDPREGSPISNPVYEDGKTPIWDVITTPVAGTDFTVTLKTGDYDFGLPEKNKECNYVEFEKEGTQGGTATLRYYVNGASSATLTTTVDLNSKFVKGPAPGVFRTLAVELEFQPDDWSGDKNNSFGLLSIGFNIIGTSEVGS